MPVGTPNNGFIPPYPIRVDTFYTPRDAVFAPPALYLLSHTHVDHLTGLNAKSFGARVICSPDAKQMLLNMEPAADRIAYDTGDRALRNRPYAHLKIDPVTREDGKIDYSMTRDLLLPVPLNSPRIFELSDKKRVSITLLDANHCLGAVMFLVEGDKGAVLHTGDFRAEPAFLSSLALNPLVQRYLAPKFNFASNGRGPTETLDAIYLDTACMLQMHQVPTKADATDGLVQLMALFPDDTRFFLNCWTWGYEDILKAVASAFQTKIHVDRYKHDIFMKTSDPFLKSLISRDENISRFHACERHDRCKQVNFPPNTESIVYVNPVDMSIERWAAYLENTRSRLQNGEPLTNLLVPLARHSPLPELQAFVRMFRPRTVVPNTLDPALHGIDYAAMAAMFEDCLAPGGAAIMKDQILSARMGPPEHPGKAKAELRNAVAVQLENVVGLTGAAEDAAQWVAPDGLGRVGAALRRFLPPALLPALERTLSARKPPPARRGGGDGSDYETTDDEQSYVETCASASSPLAARSQTGRVMHASSPNAPMTPLRKQRTMPDVSPAASSTPTPKARTGAHAGSPGRLGLVVPERTRSEPELTAIGTPYSSPARAPARRAHKPAVPRADEMKTAKAKVAGPSARPLSKQRELQARSSSAVVLERSSATAVSVELPTRSFARQRLSFTSLSGAVKAAVSNLGPSPPVSRKPSEEPGPVVATKRPSRERADERPSKRPKLDPPHTLEDKARRPTPPDPLRKSSIEQPRPPSAPRDSAEPKDAWDLYSARARSESASRGTPASAKTSKHVPVTRRNTTTASAAADETGSQDSTVLRRTSTTTRTVSRTVTETEEVIVSPPAVDEKKLKMKEKARRFSEQLKQATPVLDYRPPKRSKTDVSEASRTSRPQSNPAKPIASINRPETRPPPEPDPSPNERRMTLLSLHADEPYGLEMTLPGVGFRFRDSQGEIDDVFDDV